MGEVVVKSIPLIASIGTRDGTLTKDGRMVNCFAEKDGPDGWSAIKRPGTVVGATVPSGTPQSIALHNGFAWAVVSDNLYRIDAGGTPAAVPIPSVPVAGQQYQWVSDIVVGMSGFKTQYAGYAINGTVISKITDANYPTLTCPGLAWLNGTTYVVDISTATGRNTLRGSDLNNPLTWPALNFLPMAVPGGVAMYICNYLTYVAVFTRTSLQFYYDAGNAAGLPLSPVQSSVWLTGCANAGSVARIVDDLFFVSYSDQTGVAVSMLRGLTISKISTPDIERIFQIADYRNVYGQGVQFLGHSFYVLTGVTAGGAAITMAYDITEGSWAQWSSYISGAETGFVGVHGLLFNAVYYMQDRISGTCLQFNLSATQDDIGTVRGTQPIYTRVVTDLYDWNTMKRKFFGELFLIADNVASTIALNYTDDDYNTFSTPRVIDLSNTNKRSNRWGSSRRRAWQLLHTAATSLRLYNLEVEISQSAE